MPTKTDAPPKVKPKVEPEPTRRVNPERVCPDQIRRVVEPLRYI